MKNTTRSFITKEEFIEKNKDTSKDIERLVKTKLINPLYIKETTSGTLDGDDYDIEISNYFIGFVLDGFIFKMKLPSQFSFNKCLSVNRIFCNLDLSNYVDGNIIKSVLNEPSFNISARIFKEEDLESILENLYNAVESLKGKVEYAKKDLKKFEMLYNKFNEIYTYKKNYWDDEHGTKDTRNPFNRYYIFNGDNGKVIRLTIDKGRTSITETVHTDCVEDFETFLKEYK